MTDRGETDISNDGDHRHTTRTHTHTLGGHPLTPLCEQGTISISAVKNACKND